MARRVAGKAKIFFCIRVGRQDDIRWNVLASAWGHLDTHTCYILLVIVEDLSKRGTENIYILFINIFCDSGRLPVEQNGVFSPCTTPTAPDGPWCSVRAKTAKLQTTDVLAILQTLTYLLFG